MWWNSPFVLRDVKGWACASWTDVRIKRAITFYLFYFRAQRTRCSVCAETYQSLISQSPSETRAVTSDFRIILCQVLMMMMWQVCYSQGTFCTFDCLLFTWFIKTHTHLAWGRTRHMALVQPPHTQASITLLNAHQQWEENDCTHWDSIYTVALSKYTQNKLE